MPKSAEDEWTPEVRSEFVKGGLNYFYTKSLARMEQWWSGLKESPKVTVERPVIFVSGFQAPLHQFDTTLNHLTEDGHNGGKPIFIKNGEFYADELGQTPVEAPGDAKVFKLVTTSHDTPVEIADALELADAAVRRHTGSELCDMVAHSLGGLGVRMFCDRGNKAAVVCMVGTPNQGSRGAMLAKAALQNDISWAASMAHVSAASIPALQWMVPTANGNEKLETLNAQADRQLANTQKMVVIAASGLDSPNSFEPTGPGDGLIEFESTTVGHIPRIEVTGGSRKNHYTQVNDPDVFLELARAFDWKKA